jgi:hypothetical protein
MALVFLALMLMQTISAGAFGGAIASTIARALGSGRCTDADALMLHSLGYGTASRVEYLLIPLAFGLGSPLVAVVGTCMAGAFPGMHSTPRGSAPRSQ